MGRRLFFVAIILILQITAVFNLYASSVSAPYMTIMNYHGQKNFRKAGVMGLKFSNGRFHFDQIGQLRSNSLSAKKPCQSILGYNQRLQLQLMHSISYLSIKELLLQESVENDVIPDQVKVVEVGTIQPKKDLNVGKITQARKGRVLKSILGIMDTEVEEVKMSGLWMISGQTISRDSNGRAKLIHHPLPWQNDPLLKENPRLVFDRSKYRYVWELGRAGETQIGTILKNVRAASLLAYQEYRRLSSVFGEAEGYIMAHALDADHTALFERLYRGKRFPEDWDNDENSVLISPLSQFIKRYHPQRISGRINDLITLSRGAIDFIEALELLDLNLTLIRDDLDLSIKGSVQEDPIILEDMTHFGFQKQMKAKIFEMIPRPARDGNADAKLFRYLARNINNEEPQVEKYQDYSGIFNMWSRLAKLNAIHISNISESEVLKNSNYLPSVIKSAYMFYLKRMNKYIKGDASNFLTRNQVNFCVRTKSKIVAEELKLLGLTPFTDGVQDARVIISCMSVDRVKLLKSSDGAKLEEGFWHVHRLLSHPLQF